MPPAPKRPVSELYTFRGFTSGAYGVLGALYETTCFTLVEANPTESTSGVLVPELTSSAATWSRDREVA
jgi:hypothetical protein